MSPTRLQPIFDPGLVRALEHIAIVHGLNWREVEIALAVHREGEGHGVEPDSGRFEC